MKHVQTIADMLRRLLIEGEQVPPIDGPEFEEFGNAIGALQRRNSESDYAELGAHALGALLDRSRAAIGATEALRRFIQPGAFE